MQSKKGAGRLGRTVRSLGVVTLLGVALAGYNAYSLHRDVGLATGAVSEAQHEWFLGAVDRPDIALFFKALSHEQRMQMAVRIGSYRDPKLAPLVGTLLGTFDAPARTALTDALVQLGAAGIEPVAEQLKLTGSLQQFAVASALRRLGPAALPAVADQLAVADARPAAVAFLVAAGHPSVSILLSRLDSQDSDVRLAVVDALGKLRATEAVPRLLALYRKAADADREPYLSALAGIGDSAALPIFESEARNEASPTPRRSAALLGLGREGSASAIATLWSLSRSDELPLRDAVVSALQLAGSRTLATAATPEIGLRVAAGLNDAVATAYILRWLPDRKFAAAAAGAAAGRPSLVPALTASLRGVTDGVAIDAVARALATTPEGLRELQRLTRDPVVGGFAMRRLRLAGA